MQAEGEDNQSSVESQDESEREDSIQLTEKCKKDDVYEKQNTKKRRWDVTEEPTSESQGGKKVPKNYKSWRKYKQTVQDCLVQSRGDVSFTRRYMLFKEGVLLPRNVIHYYNPFRLQKTKTAES
nr:MAG: 22 kDa protein [unidentified adenovirus]